MLAPTRRIAHCNGRSLYVGRSRLHFPVTTLTSSLIAGRAYLSALETRPIFVKVSARARSAKGREKKLWLTLRHRR